MLEKSLATLAATPPPPAQERKQALADANAKIAVLESQLGIKARLMPIFNPTRAAARLAELQALAAKGVTPTPAAAAPALAPSPVEKTGDAMTDAAMLAAGVPNLRALKAKAKRDQLFATAASLPPGSLARECAEANLAKAQASLNACN